MPKLNYYNATWSLDEAQCPCDLQFLEYLKERQARNAAIFHFGSGNHHIVGLKAAEDGANNAVLSITASDTLTRPTSATSTSSMRGCCPSSTTSRCSTSANSGRPRTTATAR
jgi:hypothetical protein